MPENMPEVELVVPQNGVSIASLLKEAGLTASTSESWRMLEQGAVRINGERVEDKSLHFVGTSVLVVQVGKRRIAKILLR